MVTEEDVIDRRRFYRALLAVALMGPGAFAQMDFSGEWAPVQDEDNTGNPYVGEFLGVPMSRAASLRAQAWNASLYTLPEWQCRPVPSFQGWLAAKGTRLGGGAKA